MDIRECPYCKHKPIAPHAVNGRKYLYCSGCGLILKSPRKTDDDIERMYCSNEYRHTRAMTILQMDAGEIRRSSRIRTYIDDGKSVLDIGCSRGYVLKGMQDKGYEVMGVEKNPDWPIEGIPFKTDIDQVSGLWDNITCIHTLEHVVNPWHFADRIKELLAPGGKAIIEVPGTGTRGGPYGSSHIYYLKIPFVIKMFEPLKLIKQFKTPHEAFIFRSDNLERN